MARMKVLYLFTGYRGELLERARAGEDTGNGFWGMLKLSDFGIEAEHIELEQYFPKSVSKFLRSHILSVYWVHLPLYWKFFFYDIVFTSTGFGTQLVHTLLHVKRPKWVMYDFSITGLIGKQKTLSQKLFAWMTARSAGIVTISQKEADKLREKFPHLRDRIAYIPYGLDLNFFKPHNTPEEQIIFAPGRDPDRDYATLFKASRGLGASVVVTTHADRLEKFQPLPDYIQLQSIPNEEMPKEYARAAVVVIPLDISKGNNDAMGVSVLQEALAMGKAIVATRTPTTESYVTDGVNGLLVEQGNPIEMRSAIDRLLGDESLRKQFGAAARAFAEHNLDAGECTKNLAAYFKKLQNL